MLSTMTLGFIQNQCRRSKINRTKKLSLLEKQGETEVLVQKTEENKKVRMLFEISHTENNSTINLTGLCMGYNRF